jgi:hypothetical protein
MRSPPRSFWVADRVPEPSRKRVAAAVALFFVVMGSVSLASGCYGHNCDGDVVVFGANPNEGRLVSADMWESTPIDGVWLEFPKQRLWIFNLHDLGDRVPQLITPYVSAQADPNHEPGGNFALAAGNLAEISGVGKGQVVIHNGTCADYFLHVTVQAAPLPPSASIPPSPPDAGNDAETGP